MGIFGKRSVHHLGEKKKDMPEGLWTKCPSCSESLYQQALARNLNVCPECDHHFTLGAKQRITSLIDEGSFTETDADLSGGNPLGFEKYIEKIQAYQLKTNLKDAVICGSATLDSHPVTISVMDFSFLGASMGSVVGEKITRSIEQATREKRAAIVISASGGARMHEGILSLMQMAKTSGALARHSQAGLPYFSVLTHPTTGGVTASFATLGDIILAEPGAMIGFAGPRVVKETTHRDLPLGFQTSEFMLEHGLVDLIVPRADLRTTLSRLLTHTMPQTQG